jgi:5-methylcytosine-specific restriction protein B
LREIDPFTFFGVFNRGQSGASRVSILKRVKAQFQIEAKVPSEFSGVPVLDNRNSWFFPFAYERNAGDIDRLWNVFEAALKPGAIDTPGFQAAFDEALKVKAVRFKLTMGLFWIRPRTFLSLDGRMREYFNLDVDPFSFATYRAALTKLRRERGPDFPRLSYEAWRSQTEETRGGEGAGEKARGLCLIGTWSSMNDADLARINTSIHDHGGWASNWSFGIRPEFADELKRGFDLYINVGGNRIQYKFHVAEYRTGGIEGMETPWPSQTDADKRQGLNEGPSISEVFRTWFRVVEADRLDEVLHHEDFEAATGAAKGLLNQASFGYAYRRSATGKLPQPSKAAIARSQPPKNVIFYGPPGTGKTRRLLELRNSYVEPPEDLDKRAWVNELIGEYGWRPIIAAALADRGPASVPQLRTHPLLIAKAQLQERSPAKIGATLWAYLQDHTPEEVPTVRLAARRPPFIFKKDDQSRWSLIQQWQDHDEEGAELFHLYKEGPTSNGAPYPRYQMVTFHPSYGYEDFVRGIRPVKGDGDVVEFRCVKGIFLRICDKARTDPGRRYALFIDEINRANISKVFGELITLIEPDKRARYDADGQFLEGVRVALPGGDEAGTPEPDFGVPANLDIYGSMNTADRSIALLDLALRRRFEFVEVPPDYSILPTVDDVQLGQLLKRINDRLEFLLDRDKRIGHAYFTSVRTMSDLQAAFRDKIIPLLQEYFFDDYSRIQLVLSAETGKSAFIKERQLSAAALFGAGGTADPDGASYEVTPAGEWTTNDFKSIYE